MDSILTFVLIIASTSYGRPVTTIPGYPTLAACEQAAKVRALPSTRMIEQGGMQ